MRNVQEALIEGALLTVLVVFLFLNSWRSTVITGIALPISVLASFIAVWAFGFRLETMSLLGLSLAIGILIDDAIVVRENIVRHVEMGKDHYTAAREGTDEIGLAVAATTFSILAVFVPIAFMPGVGGQWFKPFALTIAASVFVSLFVSFSLDPMLSAYWKDPHKEEHEKAWITRKLDRFNAWFNRRSQDYKHVIAWALDHRLPVVIIAIGTFFGSFVLPVKVSPDLPSCSSPWRLRSSRWFISGRGTCAWRASSSRSRSRCWASGKSRRRASSASVSSPRTTTPSSTSRSRRHRARTSTTRSSRRRKPRVWRAHPEVRYTYSTLGGGTSGAVDVGNIYIKMKPKVERDVSAEEFAAILRTETQRVSGATLAVFATDWAGHEAAPDRGARHRSGGGQCGSGAGALRVSEVECGRHQPVEQGQKPELNVELHRGVAGSFGITVGQVAQALRPAFAGIDAGDWEDPSGEVRDVVVRLAPEARRRATDLRQLPLVVSGPGEAGDVPLGQVASVEQSVGPAVINHLDRDLVVNVEANVSGVRRARSSTTSRPGSRRFSSRPACASRRAATRSSRRRCSATSSSAVRLLLMYLILVMQFGCSWTRSRSCCRSRSRSSE